MAESLLLEVRGLRKVFRVRGERGRHRDFVAVDDVSFSVREGSSLAIVGESGSGKTTIARILAGLDTATTGSIWVRGEQRTKRARRRAIRAAWGRELQIVFQDPYASLDPRQPIAAGIAEVLNLHFALGRDETSARVSALLDQVGLDQRHGRALPRALSGGQRQRVAIARALAAEPRALILDESVAALDVSIQAQVLNLLADIRRQTGTSYIVISHDLAVVRQITDHVLVMRAGQVVEHGATATVLDAPRDPYTRLLRDSVPRPGWKPQRRNTRLAASEHGARARDAAG